MKNTTYILFSWVILLIAVNISLQSCNQTENQAVVSTTPYKFPSPKFFPTLMNIPPDNPTTIEGVKLGRYLYYDGRISGRTNPDSFMSCSTCHLQSKSFECGTDKFTDGFPIGAGSNATKAPHVMLPHINLVYNFNYTWNGGINNENNTLGNSAWGVPQRPDYNFRNLESLFWIVLYLPYEMNSDSTKALAALKSTKHPNYPELFKAAFGTPDITVERTGKAIAQFVRTLISYNSKFDKYMRKEPGGNLTPSELRGYQLFISEPADCFHCHGPAPLFTTNLSYNNAKPILAFDPSDRYGYTHDSNDIGAYKATTLRNIELTGPYMHDGRFKTLDEVVEFYSSGLTVSHSVSPLMKHLSTGGAQLSDQQKIDLISFLKTLTDYQFISDTAFARPSDLK
jgi:cytochrome c peroxidase